QGERGHKRSQPLCDRPTHPAQHTGIQRAAQRPPEACGTRSGGPEVRRPGAAGPAGLLVALALAVALVVAGAHGLVDLLAHGTHGVLLRVAARHPHLAAQRHDGSPVQGARHDLVLLDVVGEALVVTVAVGGLRRRLDEGPRTSPALGLKSAHGRKGTEGHRLQLSDGSSGYVATIASSLRWRRSTSRHSRSGAGEETSPGSDSTTYQAPSASSSSSWPGPQPAYPAKMRSEPTAGASSSGGASRSTRPIAPCTRRQPSGAASPACSPGTTATPRAESRETGPPWKTTPGSPARSAQPSRMSPTSTGVGRFRTTPSEPSSSWSRRSTTARSKFGSARAGVATSNRPVSEDTSVMPDMIPHLRIPWGGNGRTGVDAAQGGPAHSRRTAVPVTPRGRRRTVRVVTDP